MVLTEYCPSCWYQVMLPLESVSTMPAAHAVPVFHPDEAHSTHASVMPVTPGPDSGCTLKPSPSPDGRYSEKLPDLSRA